MRPTYAGNALTKVKTSQLLNFLTFRASSFDEAAITPGNPQVQDVEVPTDTKTTFVK
mgnify:CR=1 FL=1